MIRVQPAPEVRVAFARWAVAQRPKVRTYSTNEFAVPPALFTWAPEELLIGSVVDGHRYRSPLEDERLAAASEVHTGIPGEALPLLPDSAYGPDAVPLPEPERQLAATSPAAVEAATTADVVAVEVASADQQAASTAAAPSEGEGAGLTCDVCTRPFTTRRGRDMHRRQAHPEA
ncbi:hypothetical protein ABT300_09015 [Streptomyces sp. NPDC001027]|uniref:hypothetical protein n=1 Tax=Streptomyces sp. NPDC001027 TaxID=3154771 RepID=UPI0033226212